jgi:hypothetical protein
VDTMDGVTAVSITLVTVELQNDNSPHSFPNVRRVTIKRGHQGPYLLEAK